MPARDNDWEWGNDRPQHRRSHSQPREVHHDDYYDGHMRSKPIAAFEAPNLRYPPSRPTVVFDRPDSRRKGSFEDRLPVRPRTPVAPRYANGYLSPPDDTSYSAPASERSPKIRYHKADRSPSSETLSPDVAEPRPRRAPREKPTSMMTTILPEDARSSAPSAHLEGRLGSRRPVGTVAPSTSRRRPLSSASSSGRLLSSASLGIPSDKAFRYRELGWMEFRLVRILPERMSTIKCEIIHATLENPPTYIAISYAWGDSGDTRKIQVEGSSFPITSNLYGALKVLRRKSEAVMVWADALCIDQQNRDERTQQVQLMTSIYSKADTVAVWLGPEADDSELAVKLLDAVAAQSKSPELIKNLISSQSRRRDFAALISLFERDYWRRLWVVQEGFNARDITVYCGLMQCPWVLYTDACDAFRRHKGDLDLYFPGGASDGERHTISQNHLPYSQVLVYQGPGSFPDLRSLAELGEGSLLEVLRTCRRKLAVEPRDKVFGILGILPEEVRVQFPPDYGLSVKEVYTNVVDYLLTTTERLDVICEAIYFPLHTSSANLPSWVPDWSHIPQIAALGLSYDFSAADTTKARFAFKDDRRTKLEISAIYLDTIQRHGVAVGTLCRLDNFLMAFLHWRAQLLENHDATQDRDYDLLGHEAFCRTLCLDQTLSPEWKKPREWMTVCYHVFTSLVRSRLPHLPLDRDLRLYADAKINFLPQSRRRILQENCGARMMGRCFCLTDEGLMGMGSGFMSPGDVVVVPLGCYTPVILRPEGGRGEYRFVGDVYIDRYMRGRAVDQWREGRRELRKYVLR
jgi:hypothetical protein